MTSSKPSMFSTSFPPSPLPTDEEFNLFHSIDRRLYRKLVIVLGRDIAESMKVMAFWLWLEKQGTGGRNLVYRMLSFTCNLLNDIAAESVVCLKFVDKDHFSYSESAHELNLISNMLGGSITLNFFYERRTMVLNGVAKMLNEICDRAFKDINQKAPKAVARKAPGHVGHVNRGASSSSGVVDIGPFTRSLSKHTRAFGGIDDQSGSSRVGSTVQPVFHTKEGQRFNWELQKQERHKNPAGNDELSEILNGKLNLQDEENNAFPDDRTIILTFSSHNPISEDEFREFFTRTFGDFIEAIHMEMQPFSRPGETVLCAQMVARMASMVDEVVNGGIAEYFINGKYVEAQKSGTKGFPSGG